MRSPRHALPPGLLLLLTALLGCQTLPIYRSPPWRRVPFDWPPPEANEGSEVPAGRFDLRLPGRVAVRTFLDARPAHHRTARPIHRREYGGITGEAVTRDDRWARPPAELFSDVLAEALASSGLFRGVVRVEGDAPTAAEYELSGRLRRFRGWQAYRVEPESRPRVLKSLGDVFADRIVLRHRPSGRTVFIGKLGAMVRRWPALDPYALARWAAFEAVRAFLEDLSRARPEARLAEVVHLGPGAGDPPALFSSLPAGWRARPIGPEAPEGWRGPARCRAYYLDDETRRFFHPLLGRYHPALRLWLCPPHYRARLRTAPGERARFPADLLGLRPDGAAVFVLSLGQTSWPAAEAEITRFLSLSRPEAPVLEVGR